MEQVQMMTCLQTACKSMRSFNDIQLNRRLTIGFSSLDQWPNEQIEEEKKAHRERYASSLISMLDWEKPFLLALTVAKFYYISVQCTFVCLRLLFCFVWVRLYHMIACSIQYATQSNSSISPLKFRSFIDTDVFSRMCIHANDKFFVVVAVAAVSSMARMHARIHVHTVPRKTLCMNMCTSVFELALAPSLW